VKLSYRTWASIYWAAFGWTALMLLEDLGHASWVGAAVDVFCLLGIGWQLWPRGRVH
jgi:hypothetical protein